MVRRAACCCGESFIEVEGDPAINGLCHCANCQRRTGSAFGWSAYFPEVQVLRKDGHLRIYKIEGNIPQQRWFCSCCGSTLFWVSASFTGFIGIAAGCFADSSFPAPTVTLTEERRCLWIGLPADLQTSL